MAAGARGPGMSQYHALPTDGRGGFAIRLGLLIAAIGFVFTLLYGVLALIGIAYPGAGTGVGLTFSILVIVLGVGLATIVWVSRELLFLGRSMSRRRDDG